MKYIVRVYTADTPRKVMKQKTIYAPTWEEAEEKACYIIAGWDLGEIGGWILTPIYR